MINIHRIEVCKKHKWRNYDDNDNNHINSNNNKNNNNNNKLLNNQLQLIS